MTDVIDQAQQLEGLYRERALDGVRAAARALSTCPTSRRLCSCGDPIEEERLAAAPGARRCLRCQEAFERRLKLYRSF